MEERGAGGCRGPHVFLSHFPRGGSGRGREAFRAGGQRTLCCSREGSPGPCHELCAGLRSFPSTAASHLS